MREEQKLLDTTNLILTSGNSRENDTGSFLILFSEFVNFDKQ